MAVIANVDFQFFPCTARRERIAATTANRRFEILRMNILFHGLTPMQCYLPSLASLVAEAG